MDRKYTTTVALLSFSLLAIELIWTRILAAEFFYTFAFLVLSQAILGLGLGALSLRLFPRLDSMGSMRMSLLSGGVMIMVGPPLGFFMGMPFPKGVRHVGPLVDWSFAVNGAASVLGSTVTILLVISWGYSIGLGVALILYGTAGLLIRSNSSG